MILSIQDFTGKYALHTGMYDQSKLQNYIDIYEPRYLKNLFGIDLYNQFQSDLLSNVPQSPNFLKIFNEFSEDLGYSFYTHYGYAYSSNQLDSEGILQMLKGFIYFEYSKDLVNQMTPYGNVKPLSENSEVANTGFSMIYTRFNEAIRSYRSIQSYIRYNNPPTGQIVDLSIINGGGGYLTTNGLAIINGNGVGATCNVVANNIGGIYLFTVTANGSGYTDGTYTITTGSGYDATVTITTNLGAVVTVEIDDPGFDYGFGDVITIPGGNDDAFFTVDNVMIGSITSVQIVEAGKDFKIGNFINIKDGVNLSCNCEINYVGIGNYNKFRGIAKSTAYWL
jgi:hypothetical protein